MAPKKDRPEWIEAALQGISYWMGWNNARYRHWPLTEGAIVAELQRIISSKLKHQKSLYSEVDLIGTGERADIVIAKKTKGKRPEIPKAADIEAVIEVKRAKIAKKGNKTHTVPQGFKEDIDYLKRIAPTHKGARLFVIVTSEGRPLSSTFIKDGKAVGKMVEYSDSKCEVRSSRYCKATPGSGRTSFCACLIKVIPPQK